MHALLTYSTGINPRISIKLVSSQFSMSTVGGRDNVYTQALLSGPYSLWFGLIPCINNIDSYQFCRIFQAKFLELLL